MLILQLNFKNNFYNDKGAVKVQEKGWLNIIYRSQFKT